MFLVVFFVGMTLVILSRFYVFIEQQYALKFNSPFFRTFILFKKTLPKSQRLILERKFLFYNQLDHRDKTIFQHRMVAFINSKTFIGREGLKITDDMKTLISATAVMLTFGFRNYKLHLFENIIVYPKMYYSQINETYHKGEINPRLKTIVFSWEDFEHGYKVGDDNLNLGIHEFGHAIHLNAFKNSDISSQIFNNGFGNITTYLNEHKTVRFKLIESRYFREYAFTNHYEFFAVLLENFMETPEHFRYQFPELYRYMKGMLNFNFANY
ncbi:zinc-dependent peptidase [uncultured Winogradskyella sp.]|uniref:zinc-dependent peptidase n=1 Tax=uncultured Winogradskyella sp. TaxID=395353 RepID=UPI002614053A|nr:zinc-dependent peptidase [uncultured Winogradskyella sp.]